MIFCDLDGVLVDFIGPALTLHDRDANRVLSEWPAGVFDVCHVLGMSGTQFWKKIDSRGFRFWESLPDYPWTDAMIEILNCHDFVIASSPSWSPDSSSGKVGWMQAKFGRGFRAYMLGTRKELLANPDAILIDDNESNCEKFESAGGQAILFPRPWNRLAGISDPMPFVVESLRRAGVEV